MGINTLSHKLYLGDMEDRVNPPVGGKRESNCGCVDNGLNKVRNNDPECNFLGESQRLISWVYNRSF